MDEFYQKRHMFIAVARAVSGFFAALGDNEKMPSPPFNYQHYFPLSSRLEE